jgi:FkbM family methyltransferase
MLEAMNNHAWIKPTSLLGAAADAIHSALGSRETMAKLAIKIRNQMNMIVGKHLGQSCNSYVNGEYYLLEVLKGKICTFVDIGANSGEWTEALLSFNPDATGHLYDPSRACCEFLRAKFQDNRIIIHDKALSNFEGIAEFAEEVDRGETSSLNIYSAAPGAIVRQVNVSTFDRELLSNSGPIDFVKIDAEGSDFQVIQGAQEALKNGCIRWLQFEYNASWLDAGSSLKNALQFFDSIHFDTYLLSKKGLTLFDYSQWGDFYAYANFLAVRRDSLSLLSGLIVPSASP